MYDLVSAGESLIDFLQTDTQLSFSGSVGGAPLNAAAAAAKLGSRTAFVGMVGEDLFGKEIVRTAQNLGIDSRYIAQTNQAPTTLAFVQLDEKGERSFSFYRSPGADCQLCIKHMPFAVIKKSRAFLCGGVALSKDPERATIFYTLSQLQKTPVLKAFDPNWRPSLWENAADAKALCRAVMKQCDVLKLSAEEAVFFSGEQNPLDGAKKLKQELRVPLVLLTKGADGCDLLLEQTITHLDAVPTKVVDTTAAGDSFFGAFLHHFLQNTPSFSGTFSPEPVLAAARFALRAAAVTISKKGSIESLPGPDEL